MNYYFPYMNTAATNTGILSKIFKNGINWSTILSNAQKALNIVNQAIPVVKQVGPVMNNAKTMFKIMNEFKKVETPNTKPTAKKQTIENEKNDNIKTITKKENNNNPTFFQ